ncbi:GntR family transcriptional regulator [soil metagenome]
MTTLRMAPADEGNALWREIYNVLEAEICNGTIPAANQLPSETRLADRFGVHRLTIRRAVQCLQQAGLVRIERGRGTFAGAARSRYRIHASARFEEGLDPGRKAEQVTLELERLALHDEAADQLSVAPGTPGIRLLRMRAIDGVPVVVNAKTFPAALLPDFETAYADTGSVAAVFRVHGLTYRRAWTSAEVGFPDAAIAAHLRQPAAAPVLFTRSLNVASSGHRCEFSTGTWAMGRVELVFEH